MLRTMTSTDIQFWRCLTAMINYLIKEILSLAEFPGINAQQVQVELDEAGGNIPKLTDLYNKLMEDCYGDDTYL